MVGMEIKYTVTSQTWITAFVFSVLVTIPSKRRS
jgi:hypothetical protein